MSENYKLIEDLARKDAAGLVEKGKTYGDSWKKRGGVGAMMMLARKWDRIENICRENNWDIFAAAGSNVGEIMDDIEDLRRYLLLVQAHVESEVRKAPAAPAMPVPRAPATTPQAPTSAQQHGQPARPAACKTCGAPGNHAGFPCPREMMNRGTPYEGEALGMLGSSIRSGGRHVCEDCGKQDCICGAPKAKGYVDQD